MILHDEKIGQYKLQLVDGKDICDTYMMRGVYSCMQYNLRTQFYAFVDGLKLLRILDNKDNVLCRALIWKAYKPDGTILKYCDNEYFEVTVARDIFLENWKRFAEQRSSSAPLEAKINPGWNKSSSHDYPYLDTFCYLSASGEKLRTNPGDSEVMLRHHEDDYDFFCDED